MKTIVTTNTKRAVKISEEDFAECASLRWYEKRSAASSYVVRAMRVGTKIMTLRLHRFIVERMIGPALGKLEIHHVNGDPFDNSRENLRPMRKRDHRDLHARTG